MGSLRQALAARGRSGTTSLSAIASSLNMPRSIGTRALVDRLLQLRIVAMGDSVMWGQGLPEHDKAQTLLAKHAAARYPHLVVSLKNVSHSGAVIGALHGGEIASPIFGEVPTDRPTLYEQAVLAEQGVGSSIDLIVACMGINDVNFRNIIDPFGDAIEPMTRAVCLDKTKALLRFLRERFPTALILFHGYYPILSRSSRLTETSLVLAVLAAIAGGPLAIGAAVAAALGKIQGRCEQFFEWSERYFELAAQGLDRTWFVRSAYSGAHALFAPDCMLFSLNPDLSLQDDPSVMKQREAACEVHKRGDFSCPRASVGHPNALGARRTAEKLNQLFDECAF